MPTIIITVRNKAANTAGGQYYVCSNSDYTVTFDFDEEWAAYDVKTARFVHNSLHEDVVFSGNVCSFPKINDAEIINVGVYAGDLKTTTPAIVQARRSILSGSTTPQPPQEDVYSQIMEQLNRIDENIDNSVASALETAKESGEFDGPQGEKGEKGDPGVDAELPEVLPYSMMPNGYPKMTEGVVVIPETTKNFPTWTWTQMGSGEMEASAVYSVYLDGAVYELTATDASGDILLDGTDVMVKESGGVISVLSKTGGEHTVKVEKPGGVAEYLAVEFIDPEWIPEKTEELIDQKIQEVAGNGNAFVVNCVTSGPDGQRTLESVDKSLAEIEEAVEAGKDVYASVYHDIDGSTDTCPLSIVIPDSMATFTHLGDWYNYKVVVNAYGFFVAEWEAVPQHDRSATAHSDIRRLIAENKLEVPFLYAYMPEGYPAVIKDEGRGEILPTTSISPTASGTSYRAFLEGVTSPIVDGFVVGRSYTVKLGSTSYTTTATSTTTLGDYSLGSSTFYISANSAGTIMVRMRASFTSISVTELPYEGIQAMDAKFLPETVLTEGDLSAAIDTALAEAKASGEFDGADGAPGYTPVKGTDYYTDADKTEMVNMVIAALPTWTGGSY